MDRFLGVGISAALGISIFTMFMIILTKTVAAKYPNKATELILTI